jgi:hypothetical protein
MKMERAMSTTRPRIVNLSIVVAFVVGIAAIETLNKAFRIQTGILVDLFIFVAIGSIIISSAERYSRGRKRHLRELGSPGSSPRERPRAAEQAVAADDPAAGKPE